MNRRILPSADNHAPNTIHHPLHRFEILAAILFLSLFSLFSILILASRLNPSFLSGHVINDTMLATVNVTPSPSFSCNDTLPPGTSLDSFPCLLISVPRDEFFKNLSANGTNVLVMYRYTPWTDGKWSVYNASLPTYTVQNLNEVSRLDGIYFVMAGPETLLYAGPLPNATHLQLHPGWNLAGYPSNDTQSLDVSLATINSTYTLIETLEGTEENGTYLFANNPGGGTLTNTSIYHGYWINMTADDTWVVNS